MKIDELGAAIIIIIFAFIAFTFSMGFTAGKFDSHKICKEASYKKISLLECGNDPERPWK